MSLDAPQPISTKGADFKIGIVAARFNQNLVDALLTQATQHLIAAGVPSNAIHIHRVPGSAEVPVALRWLTDTQHYDALIGLGLLIRGDTIHYELIADSATQAIARLALDTRTPIINGIIVAETPAQAAARCHGPIQRGTEFAQSALEMATLRKTLTK
jgi:6,7-dimethyl-8-ribityllumazine synthase